MDESLLHLVREVALRHVTNDPDDGVCALGLEWTDADLHRKLRAVRPFPRQLTGDGPRRRSLAVPRSLRTVRGAESNRHDHLDVVAEQVVAGISEHPLRL